MKICSNCKLEKPESHFYMCAGKLTGRCKPCFLLYQKSNPNRKANQTRYDAAHREIQRKTAFDRYHQDIGKSRKTAAQKRRRLWKTNPLIREYSAKYNLARYHRLKHSPEYLIRKTLRARFLRAVTRNYKRTSAIQALGCSIAEFRSYLESKFLSGMAWENHGVQGWHIDHIIPCSSFDLTLKSEQQKCFHYTNLQPLWAVDNLTKGNRFTVS